MKPSRLKVQDQSLWGPSPGGPGHTFNGAKALPKAPKVGESYFATCKRDEEGHCLPEGGGDKKKPSKTKKAGWTAHLTGSNLEVAAADVRKAAGLLEKKYSVPKEVHAFLVNYVWGTPGTSGEAGRGGGELDWRVPDDATLKAMGAWVPRTSVTLYRAVRVDAKGRMTDPPGQEVKSWSRSPQPAQDLVDANAELGVGYRLLKKVFYPDEILIDTTLLPKGYQDEGMDNAQEEVVVAYGPLLKQMKKVRGKVEAQPPAGNKSLPKPPKVGESYFASCKRDEEGHCLPKGQSAGETQEGDDAIQVSDTGAHLDVSLQKHAELELANGMKVKVPSGAAKLSAMVEGDKIILSQIHVDEHLRGTGLPEAMIAKLARVAKDRGLRLTTTGVLSPKGRRMLERFVGQGLAKKEGEDFTLDVDAFLRGAGDKSTPTPLHKAGATLLSAAQKAGHAVLSTQESLKQAAGRVGQAAWNQLPPQAQQAAARTWKLAKALEHLASQGFHKGQLLAREAAKERGLSEEKVAQLGKVLALTDMALAWTVNFPMVTAATGSPWAGKASSWLPVASLGYVAYSLGRNPFKTLKAAGRLISGRVRQDHKSFEMVASLAGVLADRFQKYPDPDWWLALFACSLDETQDLQEAVRLADEAVEEGVGEAGEKSLDDYLLKSGFTGKKKDKLGREVCYKDGKRVPCTKPQAPRVQPQPSQETPPQVVGRPTKPEERCVKCEPMISLPWRAPPPPKGVKGGGKPERGVGERSQTALGDKVEALTEKIGLRNILPEGRRAHKPGEVATKGSTIDREWDSSGILVEVKMCRTTSTEYRAKGKTVEWQGKALFAKLNKAKGVVTMVPVLDEESRELHLFWHEGLTRKHVSLKADDPGGWHYAGTVSY